MAARAFYKIPRDFSLRVLQNPLEFSAYAFYKMPRQFIKYLQLTYIDFEDFSPAFL